MTTSAGGRNLPVITIVMPSYNQGQFIAEAIDSVLAQDYPAVEFTVIDGGSTDTTLDVLRSYGERVHWTSGPDKGQSDAINRGFLAASGKYIAWLNSDDRYVPGAISRAVEMLEADQSAALVYGNGEYINRDGVVTETPTEVQPWSMERLLNYGDFVFQPSAFFRRDAYLEVGGLNLDLHYCMDYDLWIRLGQKYQVRYVQQTLSQARIYAETKSATGGFPRLVEVERMLRSHGGKGLPKGMRRDMYVQLRRALGSAVEKRQFLRAAGLAVRISPYAFGAMRWQLRRLRARRSAGT
jgi:glycosyltransferase involved in cell wall biosynthesis